ncbi:MULTISPECIES: DUF883 family protein [unclassified Devosia]|jgi:ElaB/YqjD/DUF883 family membrane-anchored ribosome-binding protein|uniref:DUF883 family protein n=1 Tax=unclassified Devosia TaxID=196773 RepID=UPI0013E3FA56|nr:MULTISPECIES: DUF883 family protein [unclassified Devosia]
MANTTSTDLPPGVRKVGAASAAEDAIPAASKEQQLEQQVSQLQNDIRDIAATLAQLTGEKVTEARGIAETEMHRLKRHGQNALDEVQDQAGALEESLKQTIREKPFTAVASALGVGFILALLSRH